ncbi:tyrosine-type recombinase/integrase [Rhodococcus koreensis]
MSHTFRVVQGRTVEVAHASTDPLTFQLECVEAFVTSRVVRGFSAVTIENETGELERMLAALGKPVWEATADDVDRVVGAMAADGLLASTRRRYVQALSSFHRFLITRRAGEIEALFGVRLTNPIDEFNASRHVGDDSPRLLPPPSVSRVAVFFDFLKERIGSARKYAPAARDYALFRTLYHAGLRSDEASKLEIADVYFGRGPFGKLHVRFGKGARTSGPRPRWVPMLDHLDLVVRWYLEDVRPKLPESAVLFCDQSGGAMARGTIRNRLRYLQDLEHCSPADRFSPHALRRACATHNYERGVDLVAIQQMLGHWTVGSTMRYVRPSETFIEDAYRSAISDTVAFLQGDDDAH